MFVVFPQTQYLSVPLRGMAKRSVISNIGMVPGGTEDPYPIQHLSILLPLLGMILQAFQGHVQTYKVQHIPSLVMLSTVQRVL